MSTVHLRIKVGAAFKTLHAVDGLGIKDQQNGPWVIYFCGFGPKKKYNGQSQEHFELGQQIPDTFTAVPWDCLSKNVESVRSALQKCVQNARACVDV
jgi:hypothetical protein